MDTPTSACPSCFADRPYPLTVTEGTFLPGSECPACGHVEPDLEFDLASDDGSGEPSQTLTLDADGVITRSIAVEDATATADSAVADSDPLDTFRPDDSGQAEDYARYARLMGVDPDLVFAALAGREG